MTRYTLHYNSRCQDCVRLAEWNRRLDWLGRFERTTEPSPIGTPEIGDIHVVDNQKSMVFSGAYATQVVCRNLPAYWPLAVFMKLPSVFRQVARRKPGCNGESCVIEYGSSKIHRYQLNPKNLERIHLDRDNYYSLLVDRTNKILILEVVITWVMWYSVYFWLSAEEYKLFKEDKPAFDRLTESYARDKGERFFTQRLLRNEGPGGDLHQGDEPEPIEGLESAEQTC